MIRPAQNAFINDSLAIPLDDIRFIRKGKDYVESMGYIILTFSVIALGISSFSWNFDEKEEIRQELVPYAALAAGSGSLIAIGALKSSYNMRRWKLVAIYHKPIRM